jgi:hypothetical protein
VISRLLAIAGLLLMTTGCFEHFSRLVTTVRWDESSQQFLVERRVEGVQPAFFGCSDGSSCVSKINDLLAGEWVEAHERAVAGELLKRVQESGAQDLQLRVLDEDGRIDVVASYTAALGTTAADETNVFVEWGGRPGRERNYLAVKAPAELQILTPNDGFQQRIRSYTGANGLAGERWWVMPAGVTKVATSQPVGAATDPHLEEVISALHDAGLLSSEHAVAEQAGFKSEEELAELAAARLEMEVARVEAIAAERRAAERVEAETARVDALATARDAEAAAQAEAQAAEVQRRLEQTRAEAIRLEKEQAEAVEAQAAQARAAEAARTKAEQDALMEKAARDDASAAEEARAEAARVEQARAEAARVEAARAQEEARANASRAAEQAEAVRREAARKAELAEAAQTIAESSRAALAIEAEAAEEAARAEHQASAAAKSTQTRKGPSLKPPGSVSVPAGLLGQPRVHAHPPRVDGSMDSGLVTTSVEPLIPWIETCYLQALSRSATVRGYVAIGAVVRTDASVVSLSVSGDVDDPELTQCVNQVAERWAPPPCTGPSGSTASPTVPVVMWLEQQPDSGRKRKRDK